MTEKEILEIRFKVGDNQYLGFNADRMYEVVSKEKAMVFHHGFDAVKHISKSRKKINAFLRTHSLKMLIVTDCKKVAMNTNKAELLEEAIPTKENRLALAS